MSDTDRAGGLTDEVRARRVAVARDVQERIRLGKLNLATGSYIDLDMPSMEIDDILGHDLQTCVDRVESHCEVCALGAVLLSKARLFDAVPASAILGGGSSQSRFHAALSDVFDKHTLELIESAFECSNFSATDEGYGAAIFGNRYKDGGLRCVAVMQRVIDGDGELEFESASYGEYFAIVLRGDSD